MRPSPALFLRIRWQVLHPRRDHVATSAPVQHALEAAYYRGGTSRAVIIQPQHLPKQRAKWPSIFRQIMGSGDPYGRQLDGMGAGISSLSKICLVEPYGKRAVQAGLESRQHQSAADSSAGEEELDIDYTFVGLGIENDEVDVAGNCGNMSSAIGPYAYNAGLLPPHMYGQGDGQVTVKIRNTNTGKLIDSTFEVVGGQAAVVGDYTIDGVTGSGSNIKLDFKHPYGSKTGKVLPTGKRLDQILGYKVSCVDGANPAIFIRADNIGVDGTILPNDFNKLPEKLALLERIRKTAAVAMGIAPAENLVPRTIPKIGLVSQSSTHPVLSGQTLKSTQMDIAIRFLSDTQPHRAIPLTAALTTAVAARIPGTIVEQMLSPDPVMKDAITIGHASGRLQVNATMDEKNKLVPVTATVYRTAKRLFEGNTFWNDKGEPEAEADTNYSDTGTHSLGLAFMLENRGKSSAPLYEKDAEELVQEDAAEAQATNHHELQYRELQSPPALSYRPLLKPRNIAPQLPEHPETPLTVAITQLHKHLDSLLSDPKLSTRSFPTPLTDILQSSYEKIVDHSQERKGVEWHRWARSLHKSKERVRNAVQLRAAGKERERTKHEFKGPRSRDVFGLDRNGNLRRRSGTKYEDNSALLTKRSDSHNSERSRP